MATAVAGIQRESLRRAETLRERIDPARRITLLAAGAVVALVLLLLVFITLNGVQIFTVSHVPLDKVFNTTWNPPIDITSTNDPSTSYGIFPFIAGTIGVMIVAAIIATPLSVGLALFMAEIAPRWARSIAQPSMEVFVGIPSVVWGWLGITILVPFLRVNFSDLGFTTGFSWFAGSLVLSLMILPTITAISYDVILGIPAELRSGSVALGTTRWQTIRHVVLPAGMAGIATAVVLGMMRAAGEALAVQMVIGNTPVMPSSLTKPVTTLTSQITLDMGNTVQGEPWNQALWTMGLVLLLMSFAFVVLVRWLSRRKAIA
jgi:phosphate transport system permease protein